MIYKQALKRRLRLADLERVMSLYRRLGLNGTRPRHMSLLNDYRNRHGISLRTATRDLHELVGNGWLHSRYVERGHFRYWEFSVDVDLEYLPF